MVLNFDMSVHMSLWNHRWKALWACGLLLYAQGRRDCHVECALTPVEAVRPANRNAESSHSLLNIFSYTYLPCCLVGFPGSTVVKKPPASVGDARDLGLIPGLGRSPGEGNDNSLQFLAWKSHEQRSLAGYSP